MNTPSGSGDTHKKQTSSIASRRERLSGVPVSSAVRGKASSPITGMQVYDKPELDTGQFMKIKEVISKKNSADRLINTLIYAIMFIILLAVVGALIYYLL